jgi:hypothetical protein
MFALLRRPGYRDVFLIGAVTYLATTVETWAWAGLALHVNQLEPKTVRAIVDVTIFYGPILTGTTTTIIARAYCDLSCVVNAFNDSAIGSRAAFASLS